MTTNLALWDIAAKKRVRTFDQRKTPARAIRLTLTPDGKRVLTVDSDQKVRLWDIDTGQEVWSSATTGRLPDPRMVQTFMTDGKRVAFVFPPVVPPRRLERILVPVKADMWHICIYELATGKLLSETKCNEPWTLGGGLGRQAGMR